MLSPHTNEHAGTFFLWHLKITLWKKAQSIMLLQLRVLLKVLLPMKSQSLETLISQILWIQARNHRAYLSHRKRRMKEFVKEPQLKL
jgi:hypothetical protein